MILRGIVHIVSGFPQHFMFYRGNSDCFSNRYGWNYWDGWYGWNDWDGWYGWNDWDGWYGWNDWEKYEMFFLELMGWLVVLN